MSLAQKQKGGGKPAALSPVFPLHASINMRSSCVWGYCQCLVFTASTGSIISSVFPAARHQSLYNKKYTARDLDKEIY